MEIDYTLKGEHGFTGVAKIKMLKPVERLQLLKESKIDITGGEAVPGKDAMLDIMPMMLEVVKKQVVNFHFKYGDKNFKDLDEMEYYDEALAVFMEIGSVLLEGVKLGKPSKKTSSKPAKQRCILKVMSRLVIMQLPHI